MCSTGEGSWPICFGLEKTQRREKSGLENFEIPIFLTVAQDKTYKLPITFFFERFYENIQQSIRMILVRRKSQVEAS